MTSQVSVLQVVGALAGRDHDPIVDRPGPRPREATIGRLG